MARSGRGAGRHGGGVMPSSLVIGTRGSPLALAQAHLTKAALRASAGEALDIAIRIITTSGDATQDRPLSDLGGKGLFTKEIDAAQLAGEVDLSVHSAKDLPTTLPQGLVIAGFLPREDIRDALIAPRFGTLAQLPAGARIGTVSLRRQALLRHLRPDLRVENLRGNVQSRLDKARNGTLDAVILAMAGLNRLGLADAVSERLDPSRFVPAVGQGAIALVTRADDTALRARVAAISHRATELELAAERAFLLLLDGSCKTPIGGNARFDGMRLDFAGIVLTPDGAHRQAVTNSLEAPDLAGAETLGRTAAMTLKEGPVWHHFQNWPGP